MAFKVQAALRRPILLENPSSYLKLADGTIPEVEFLRGFVLAHPSRSPLLACYSEEFPDFIVDFARARADRSTWRR